MKTSTLVVVGVGTAALLFVALRAPSVGKVPSTGKAAAAPGSDSPRTSREYLERSAISLGSKLAGGLLDRFMSGGDDAEPRDSISI